MAWSSSCGKIISIEPRSAANQVIVADFGSATGTILKNAAAPRMTSIMQATVFAIMDSFSCCPPL